MINLPYESTSIKINEKDLPIYYFGNVSLLQNPSISVTGSRKSSDLALEILKTRIKSIAKKYTVVSGYANGADEAAHLTALQNDGTTIIVLPTGLKTFYIKSIYKSCWDWNRVLVISQFDINSPWSSFNAFKRNEVIVGLSSKIISVHPGLSGGTYNATNMALKTNKQIWVTDSKSDGVELFVSAGAKKLNLGN